jgi:hypothetical protein
MYDTFVKWIGSNACTFAGHLSDGLGASCTNAQALNTGLVILALATIGLWVTWMKARIRRRREEYNL